MQRRRTTHVVLTSWLNRHRKVQTRDKVRRVHCTLLWVLNALARPQSLEIYLENHFATGQDLTRRSHCTELIFLFLSLPCHQDCQDSILLGPVSHDHNKKMTTNNGEKSPNR
mmetsp:Transcript_12813/g.27114  ORF Transcript_12813/g.27114 Transcript_12813/m.27114 type:complete len:112 (+) Transcript_12813:69-404(+)